MTSPPLEREQMNNASLPHLQKTLLSCKIATLNVCLGLASKKNPIKEIIINEKIDVLCLLETELQIKP